MIYDRGHRAPTGDHRVSWGSKSKGVMGVKGDNMGHTSFEESSRAKIFYITFDRVFWCYLPSQSRCRGSRKWRMGKFCTIAKI